MGTDEQPWSDENTFSRPGTLTPQTPWTMTSRPQSRSGDMKQEFVLWRFMTLRRSIMHRGGVVWSLINVFSWHYLCQLQLLLHILKWQTYGIHEENNLNGVVHGWSNSIMNWNESAELEKEAVMVTLDGDADADVACLNLKFSEIKSTKKNMKHL